MPIPSRWLHESMVCLLNVTVSCHGTTIQNLTRTWAHVTECNTIGSDQSSSLGRLQHETYIRVQVNTVYIVNQSWGEYPTISSSTTDHLQKHLQCSIKILSRLSEEEQQRARIFFTVVSATRSTESRPPWRNGHECNPKLPARDMIPKCAKSYSKRYHEWWI